MTKIINRYTGNTITEGDMNLHKLITHHFRGNCRGLSGADLSGADLSGADLSGADLHGADLAGANLYGADLSGADLHGANLYGAILREADMRGANLDSTDLRATNLYGADLRGAKLNGIKIKNTAVFTGLYKYVVMPVISEDGTEYIQLGSHFRTVVDWEKDFWNNPDEFPNDGDMASNLRWMAYQICLQWLKLNRTSSTEQSNGWW